MPPRSVLLNVSITAKEIGKERVVESVSEIEGGKEMVAVGLEAAAESKHDRIDSVTCVPPPPSFSAITTTPETSLAISTASDIYPFSAFSSDMALSSPACAVCSSSTRSDGLPVQRCARCKSVFYCSNSCQKQDWRSHKTACSQPSTPTHSTSSDSTASSPGTSRTASFDASSSGVSNVYPAGAMAVDDRTLRE